jgi:hypothetical protein
VGQDVIDEIKILFGSADGDIKWPMS